MGSQITLLYSHANAEDLGIMFGWLKCLARRLNVNVLAYDYTGYGESDGEPSEEACYADIEAAYDYLVNDRKLEPSQIILYGRSVGSGPATYLASKLSIEGVQVGGLVLECPFKSVYRVVADFGCTVLGESRSMYKCDICTCRNVFNVYIHQHSLNMNHLKGDKFPNIDRISSVR
jgi:pimeloyl-ACP methyl ester carboxylesterase